MGIKGHLLDRVDPRMRICPFMRWDVLNYTTRAGRVKEGNPFFHHTVFTCGYADIFSSFVASRAPMDMAAACAASR
jgi:hypothetical protein